MMYEAIKIELNGNILIESYFFPLLLSNFRIVAKYPIWWWTFIRHLIINPFSFALLFLFHRHFKASMLELLHTF